MDPEPETYAFLQRAWPGVEQRDLQEKDFVRNLVERISDTHESAAGGDVAPLVQYALEMTRHRPTLLFTELERIIRFKCVNLPSSSDDVCAYEDTGPTLAQRGSSPGKLIAFLISLFGDIVSEYIDLTSCADYHGEYVSKKIFPKIVSTVAGTAYFLSQYQTYSVAQEMTNGCGSVIRRMCKLCPAVVLSHVKVLLNKCLLPESEEKGIFYMLQSIQFLELRQEDLGTLLGDISSVIRPPGQAWKRTAMLDLNASLRACILQWMSRNCDEVRALYECAADGFEMYKTKFERNAKALLDNLEPWADGSKKRSMVWPTVCLLLSLVRNGLKEAVLERHAKGAGKSSDTSVESRFLRRTLDHLNPDLRQIMFRNQNAHLFSELSVISLVLMAQTAATLLRVGIRSEFYARPHEPKNQIFKDMLQRGFSYDSVGFFVEFFKKRNLDKLQECVLRGNTPTSLYQAMVTGQGNSALSDAMRRNEFTPSSIFVAYCWSMFYISLDRFFHVIVHILRPHFNTPNVTVPNIPYVTPNKLLRLNALRSIECILRCGITDGNEPMKFLWGSLYGAELDYCVFLILRRFVESSLNSNMILGNGEFGSNSIHVRSRAILEQHMYASANLDVTSALPSSKLGKNNRVDPVSTADFSKMRSMLHSYCFADCSAHVVSCLRIIALSPKIIFIPRHQQLMKDFRSGISNSSATSNRTENVDRSRIFDCALFRSEDAICVCLSLMDVVLCIGHESKEISQTALATLSGLLKIDAMQEWDKFCPTIGVINISSVLVRTLGVLLFNTDGDLYYSLSYRSNYFCRTRSVLIALRDILASTNVFILSQLSSFVDFGDQRESEKLKNSESGDNIGLNSAGVLAHHLAVQTAEAGLLLLICSYSDANTFEETELSRLCGVCLGHLCDRNKFMSFFGACSGGVTASDGSSPLPDTVVNLTSCTDGPVFAIYRSIADNLVSEKNGKDISCVRLLSQVLHHFIHRLGSFREGEAGLGLVWAVQTLANRWKFAADRLSVLPAAGQISTVESAFCLFENLRSTQSAAVTESSGGVRSPCYSNTWGSVLNEDSAPVDKESLHFRCSFNFCKQEASLPWKTENLDFKSRVLGETSSSPSTFTDGTNAADCCAASYHKNISKIFFPEWVRDMGVLSALGECLNICPEEIPQLDVILELTLTSLEERTTEEDIAAYMSPESVDIETFLMDTLTPVDSSKRVVLRDRQTLTVTSTHVLCSSDQLVEDLVNILVLPCCEYRIMQSAFIAIGLHLSPAMYPSLFSYITKIIDAVLSSSSLGLSHANRRTSTAPVSTVAVGPGGGLSGDGTRPETDGDSDGSPAMERLSHPIFVDVLETPLNVDVLSNIREMTSLRVVNFLNAAMMILVLVLGRDSVADVETGDKISTSPSMNSDEPEVHKPNAPISMVAYFSDHKRYLRESTALIEGILMKVISIAIKAENETVSAAAYSAEFFVLQEKFGSVIESVLATKKVKFTKRFHVLAASLFLDWVYRGMHINVSSNVTVRTGGNYTAKILSSDDAMQLILSAELTCISALAELLDDLVFCGDTISVLAETNSFSWINTDKTSGGQHGDPLNNFSETDREKIDQNFDIRIRSKVFYRFFHILSTACSIYRSQESVGIQFVDRIMREAKIAYGVRLMIDSIIVASHRALSNILNANIDIGFHHMLSSANNAGPHEIKVAMMDAFSSVLERNCGRGVDRNQTDLIIGYEQRLRNLFDLLFSAKKELFTVLCYYAQGKEAEILSRSVLTLCEGFPLEAPVTSVLKHVIFIEVYNTDKLGTLFRSESLPTKIVNMFLAAVGKSYLIEILQLPLQKFVSRHISIDVDSATDVVSTEKGLMNKDIVLKNVILLQKEATIFLQAILESINKCPGMIRYILKTIRSAVSKKFGESDEAIRVVVAGSLFLRFFCPAIAMPSKYGISVLSEGYPHDLPGFSSGDGSSILPRATARGLLLIAKCLQHIVNSTKFTEGHLLLLNAWIEEHSTDILSFCREVSDCADTAFDDEKTRCIRRKLHVVSTGDADVNIVDCVETSTIEPLPESVFDALVLNHAFLVTHRDSLLALLKAKYDRDLSCKDRVSGGFTERFVVDGDKSIPRSILKPPDSSVMVSHFGMEKYFEMDWNEAFDLKSLHGGSDAPEEIHKALTKLLDELGEPTVNAFATSFDSDKQFASGSTKSLDKSIDEYLRSVEASVGFTSYYEQAKRQKIIYVTHPTKKSGINNIGDYTSATSNTYTNVCIVWFILRRVDDSTKVPILMYIVLKEALRLYQAQQPFNIVLDSTLFDIESDLQAWSMSSWWNKLRLYVSDIFSLLARKIYIVHPSAGFVHMARKILKVYKIRTKIAGELCDVISVSDLIAELPLAKDGCPYLTRTLADGIMYRWPAVHNSRPSTVAVSGKYLVMETPDSFGGEKFVRFDTLNFGHVSSVLLGDTAGGKSSVTPSSSSSNDLLSSHGSSVIRDLPPRNSIQTAISQNVSIRAGATSVGTMRASIAGTGVTQRITITYTKSQSKELRTMVLQSAQSIQLHSMLCAALASIKQQSKLDELSAGADVHIVHADNIPGTLLHTALFHLGSSVSALRKAGYSLLVALKKSYSLRLSLPLFASESLYIPHLSSIFVTQISQNLSIEHPELAIDFITECTSCLARPKVSLSEKIACVQYLKPWIVAISKLMHDTTGGASEAFLGADPLRQKIVSDVTVFLSALINIARRDENLAVSLLDSIWSLIGRQAEFAKFALDFLLQRICELEEENPEEHSMSGPCVDPLLHDAFPRSDPTSGAWKIDADVAKIGTFSDRYFVEEVAAVRKLSSRGASVAADDGPALVSNLASPGCLGASIRNALHNHPSSSIECLTSGEDIPIFDGDFSISSTMSILTDCFSSVASQQRESAVLFLCHEINEEMLIISVLMNSIGFIKASGDQIPPSSIPPVTPKKRAADLRPPRLPNSSMKQDAGISINRSGDFPCAETTSQQRNPVEKILDRGFAAEVIGMVDTEQYFTVEEVLSSDDEHICENHEVAIFSEEKRPTSSDPISFCDYRKENFERLFMEAKNSEMPKDYYEFDNAKRNKGENPSSKSAGVKENSAHFAFESNENSVLDLCPVDSAIAVAILREPISQKMQQYQTGKEPKSVPKSTPPFSNLSDANQLSPVQRVRLMCRISDPDSSVRQKLANSWNLPLLENDVIGKNGADVDSIWHLSLLRSTKGRESTSNKALMHWSKLTILIRNFIPLLFQSEDLVINVCIDVFHVILCCLGRGPLRLRLGLQTLAYNTVHAIYTYFLNDNGASSSIVNFLNDKLVYFRSSTFRLICCSGLEISIDEFVTVINNFNEILTVVSTNAVQPFQVVNLRSRWLAKNICFLCALSPATESFRFVLTLYKLLDAEQREDEIRRTISTVIKCLGTALEASVGECQENILIDSILKFLAESCRHCSDRVLRILFWFALVALYFTSEISSVTFRIDLLSSIVQQIYFRRNSLHIRTLEEELLDDVALEIDHDEVGDLSDTVSSNESTNREALFDILTELSRAEMLGVPLLSKQSLTYSISVLLLRCYSMSDHRESCIRLLKLLDSMYVESGGTKRYGISGYACMLSCIAYEPAAVNEVVESTNAQSCDRAEYFFGAENFPNAGVALQYVTLLLSMMRSVETAYIKIKIHGAVYRLVLAMPVLSICLHELLFEELSREFDRVVSTPGNLSSLVCQSINALLQIIQNSHPVGGKASRYVLSPEIKKAMIDANSMLTRHENAVAYDNLKNHSSGDFISSPTETEKIYQEGSPQSPPHSVSNQSTPLDSVNMTPPIECRVSVKQLSVHNQSDITIVTSPDAARNQYDKSTNIYQQVFLDFGALNALDICCLKKSNPLSSSMILPVCDVLTSVECDLLRMAIINVERTIKFEKS